MNFRRILLVFLALILLSYTAEAALVELNPENFKNIVENPKKHVFVMFYAPWCGHCHHMMPIWEDLGKKYGPNDNVVIARIDASTHRNFASKYGVQGFPTLKLFPKSDKSGNLEYSGKRELADMQEFLRLHTKK